jgi:hypothetical protein
MTAHCTGSGNAVRASGTNTGTRRAGRVGGDRV